jgi:hypothetical protein
MPKDKPMSWNPDEVIKRPVDPKIAEERAKMGMDDEESETEETSLPLTEEQKRARAERFVWKPGDLRRVR